MVGLKDIKIELDRGYTRSINNTQYLPEDDLNFYKETHKSIFLYGTYLQNGIFTRYINIL
jgi:hypothetical protein